MSTDDAHLGPPKVECSYDPEEGGRALAFLIMLDIEDRCGLGDAWNEIDDRLQREILRKWAALISETLTEFRDHYSRLSGGGTGRG